MQYNRNGMIINVDDEVFKKGPEFLYLYKVEIDDLLRKNLKLAAVKAIKEYSGFGLKSAKNLIDLYQDGKILPKPDVREERRKKLEKLAKTPLVEELITSLKKLGDDKIHSLLMNLTIDELFNIDEFINKKI